MSSGCSNPPVYVPTPIISAHATSVPQYSVPSLTRKQKRNRKRNMARRGNDQPRSRDETRRETQSIEPNDPYWNPAFEKAVVAVNAHFVNRRAKMEDNAEVIVRSFNDGTVTAIRDDAEVILIGPVEDSSRI